MTTATWNGTVIASSDNTEIVEGNRYFPADSITPGVLVDSATTSICPWKGTASYYSVVVDGEINADAAWHHPAPKDAATGLRDPEVLRDLGQRASP